MCLVNSVCKNNVCTGLLFSSSVQPFCVFFLASTILSTLLSTYNFPVLPGLTLSTINC